MAQVIQPMTADARLLHRSSKFAFYRELIPREKTPFRRGR
jgi:hypothetical protein